MDIVKDFLNETWNFLAASGVTEHELLALLFLIAALQLLVGLLSRLRKVRRVDYTAINSRLDHLSIQVADLNSKLTRHLEMPAEKKNYEDSAVARPVPPQAVIREPVLVPVPVPLEEADDSLFPEPEAAPVEARGIFGGLKKTRDAFRSRLQQVFSGGRGITAETMDELEELLISSDLGVRATARLLEGLSLEAKARGSLNGEEAKEILKERVRGLLGAEQSVEVDIARFQTKPVVILVVGVNGVGKTTTIGKLAKRFADQGLKVTLAACDTFRAAAVEQIRIWGERSGVEVISGGEGVKPTTVLYQAFEKVNARGDQVLIVDTAGRLHTRVNLMNELGSIVSMIERLCPGAPHESLLVVDATTGQNALEQAKEFGKKVKLTGLVVTKLDGTPKGGIVVAIREELGIPIRYVGVGEGTEDLRVFRADEFVEALFDDAPQMYRGEQKRALAPGAGLVH